MFGFFIKPCSSQPSQLIPNMIFKFLSLFYFFSLLLATSALVCCHLFDLGKSFYICFCYLPFALLYLYYTFFYCSIQSYLLNNFVFCSQLLLAIKSVLLNTVKIFFAFFDYVDCFVLSLPLLTFAVFNVSFTFFFALSHIFISSGLCLLSSLSSCHLLLSSLFLYILILYCTIFCSYPLFIYFLFI